MIYLDANASSRLRPQAVSVIETMLKESSNWSNPSSIHTLGRKARSLLSIARQNVHALLKKSANNRVAEDFNYEERLAHKASVFFTSGGTESCNAMVNGFLLPLVSSLELSNGKSKCGHLLSTGLEHAAMLKSLRSWSSRGFDLTLVEPEIANQGQFDSSDVYSAFVSPGQILDALREDTCLVSVMAANNETGALQPVSEISLALRSAGYRGAIISDITQAIGKSECDVSSMFRSGVDAVALSGHKLGAPSGVGVTVLRGCDIGNDLVSCLPFVPMLLGGEQEKGLRSGTENLLGIVALGAVCEYLSCHIQDELRERKELRDMLYKNLKEGCSDCHVLTPLDGFIEGSFFRSESEVGSDKYNRALANTLLIRFPGCRADDLVVALDLEGILVSAGSACHSGKQGVSHVLKAMHLDDEEAREYIRISLDWDATKESVLESSEKIIRVVSCMRTCEGNYGR